MTVAMVCVCLAMWWLSGIIATIMLYRQGIIVFADLGFLCLLSVFPGPFAFFELSR